MFDHHKFLTEEFRSPDGVVTLLGRHCDRTPRPDTVRKWFERGAVPGEWLGDLILALELDRAEPVSLLAYRTVSGGVFD